MRSIVIHPILRFGGTKVHFTFFIKKRKEAGEETNSTEVPFDTNCTMNCTTSVNCTNVPKEVPVMPSWASVLDGELALTVIFLLTIAIILARSRKLHEFDDITAAMQRRFMLKQARKREREIVEMKKRLECMEKEPVTEELVTVKPATEEPLAEERAAAEPLTELQQS